jgi:hypothetical protein
LYEGFNTELNKITIVNAAATPGSGNNNQTIDQPITRRRIIERGVYTFVASLFPSYGHDPHIAEALDNAQQDEVI